MISQSDCVMSLQSKKGPRPEAAQADASWLGLSVLLKGRCRMDLM